MEELERSLPTISLVSGVDFYVDSLKNQLIDTQDRSNIIHVNDMLSVEDHFEMILDKATRNLKESDWAYGNSDRYVMVWLRPLEVYDLEGAKLRLEQEAILIPKNLPVIDIAGENFLWDSRESRLLQQSNPYNQIHKNDIQIYDGRTGLYFDVQRKVVPFPQELEALKIKGNFPPHIHFIKASEIIDKINKAKNLTTEIQPKKNGRKLR